MPPLSGWLLTCWLGLLPSAAAAALPAPPAGRFLYIPPAFEPAVRFYHSFGAGAGRAEILPPGAALGPTDGQPAAGLTGPGLAGREGGRGVALRGVAMPLSRPLTVSLWFRLDEPMKPETGFHLLTLRTKRGGYISNFVRGKGTWCALTRPTFVIQVYRFEGISNVNGIRFGEARLAGGVWHHAAVAVSERGRVRVWWDGTLRCDFTVKGRLFGAGDVVTDIAFGPHWLGWPMTIDELLVLDRAVSGAEVRAYVTAVRRLAEGAFPYRAGAPAGGGDDR